MSTVLYIKASCRKDRSHCLAVADAFIGAYLQKHPHDEVKAIDIFEKELPEFGPEAVTAKYKIIHKREHTEQDRKIWSEVVEVTDEFKSADKYVFAVPMWNFSIPYQLKHYIDILVQPGLTFAVTGDGDYCGLVTNKPVFAAYARGGEYSQTMEKQKLDMQKSYLELILRFIGLADIRSVTVEPTLSAGATVAGKRRTSAVEQAIQMAKAF